MRKWIKLPTFATIIYLNSNNMRGGKRENAGRKKGDNNAIRIDIRVRYDLMQYLSTIDNRSLYINKLIEQDKIRFEDEQKKDEQKKKETRKEEKDEEERKGQ